MSSGASHFADLPSAISASCDRLVSGYRGADRTERRRLAGALLFGPVLLAISAAMVLPLATGTALTLALIFAMFAAGWLGVLIGSTQTSTQALGGYALITAVPAVAFVTAAAGGLSAPATLLIAALPLEAYWVMRGRTSLVLGAAAGVAAIALQTVLTLYWPQMVGEAAAWHWLIPVFYASTLWARLGMAEVGPRAQTETVEPAQMLEALGVAFVEMSSGGEVFRANARVRDLLHLSPSLLMGSGFFDRIHVADRVSYMCALSDLRAGTKSQHISARLRLPNVTNGDGPDLYVPCTLDLIASETNQAVAVMIRDNSELVDLRGALAAQAEKSGELEIAKSRFLATVSHELRTPLTAIIGFSDSLLHELFGGFADPRQREYTSLIRDSGNHLLEVVNSILDVSKIESGTYTISPEPFRFADAAEMCHAMMSLQAERKKVMLEMQVSRSVGDVVADRRAVQQILINLVANAVKFTPEGGQVQMGAQRVGSQLHFWVNDNGIGIDAADLERVGRPFTQIRNDYSREFEGTGLGLSLVKGLVALHGGAMSIESACGEGTKVSISMPIDGPKSAREKDAIDATLATKHEVTHATLRKTA